MSRVFHLILKKNVTGAHILGSMIPDSIDVVSGASMGNVGVKEFHISHIESACLMVKRNEKKMKRHIGYNVVDHGQ